MEDLGSRFDGKNDFAGGEGPSSGKHSLALVCADEAEDDVSASLQLPRAGSATLIGHGVYSHAFGEAHDQLDHFFENSMLDLRRREIEIEGIVLLSKRRLMV